MADLSRSFPSKIFRSKGSHTQEGEKINPAQKALNQNKSLREVILHNWSPILGENKLILSGTLEGYNGEWRTTRVLSRKSEREIVTKSKIYILVGPMKLPEDKELRNKIPLFIQYKFQDGFPENWELLVQHWRSFISTQLLIKEDWTTLERVLEDCNNTNNNSLSPESHYVRSVPTEQPCKVQNRRLDSLRMSLCNQSHDVSCFFTGNE